MRDPESLSFETDALSFLSSSESGRNRERLHLYPPNNEMAHEHYRSIAKSVTYNTRPKRIFIRNGDHYKVVDPKELEDLRNLAISDRRRLFNSLAAEMYWSDEVIIEDAVPDPSPKTAEELLVPILDPMSSSS